MRYFFKVGFSLLTAMFTNLAAAQGSLEIPGEGSYQSGISLVSGWHCSGQLIEVSFNGGDRITAASGTTRGDTIGPCGDDNNGFAFLWAWSLLGEGEHTATAYADGVEFATNTFTVSTLDEDFVVGAEATARVKGFNNGDNDLVLEWQEANQNFVIKEVETSGDPADINGVWRDPFGQANYIVVHNESWDGPGSALVDSIMLNPANGRVFALEGEIQEGTAALSLILDSSGNGQTGTWEWTLVDNDTIRVRVLQCNSPNFCEFPSGTEYTMERFY